MAQAEQLERLPPEGLPPEEPTEESAEKPEKLPPERPAKPPSHQQQAGEASCSRKCARRDATDCGMSNTNKKYSEQAISVFGMTREQAIDGVPGVITMMKDDSPKSGISSIQMRWAGYVPVPDAICKISPK